MVTIGIAGGVASGKSVIAGKLQELGAVLIDGDQLGHEVLRQAEVIAIAREHWGDQVIDGQGQIDRAAVARRVFGSQPEADAELEFWEACTHPRITRLLENRLKQLTEQKDVVVVLDAPVMFKAGWDRLCDHLIFVDCPHPMRLERALKRSNWDEKQFTEREASQLSLDEKRRRASFVIDNSASVDETYAQVLEFWSHLSD